VARDLPLVAIASLETMAAKTQSDKVLALLDARMGEVYSACYVKGGREYRLTGEIRVSLPEEIQTLPDAGWLACGNALKAYPLLAERFAAAGISMRPETLPEAGVLASLAVARVERGEVIDPSLAAPLYVRNKVAKTVAERLLEGGKA
jgi:tRNA threonylcarbamoyladenosine biosynthesis protein TsaB